MQKFEACTKCKDGYLFEEDHGVAKKCECLKTYQNSIKLVSLLDKAGLFLEDKVPFESYTGENSIKSLDNIRVYLNKYKEKYERSSSLYLWSSLNGTQKTTIAKNILISLLEKGYTGKFMLFSDFVMLLMDTRNEESLEKIKFIEKCDVLVLDDCFMKSKVTLYSTGYQFAFIDQFIRRRMESDKKNIIFTSNVPISSISSEGFTKDIQDVLYRNISVKKAELSFNDRYNFKIESMFDEA